MLTFLGKYEENNKTTHGEHSILGQIVNENGLNWLKHKIVNVNIGTTILTTL